MKTSACISTGWRRQKTKVYRSRVSNKARGLLIAEAKEEVTNRRSIDLRGAALTTVMTLNCYGTLKSDWRVQSR